jgi:hypothetical protein
MRWSPGLASAFVVIPALGSLQDTAPLLFWPIAVACVTLTLYSAFRIVAAINRLYRCPACEKLVTDTDGIELDPASCPHCGAILGPSK